MQYLLTGIDTHLDYGFGVTGDSYYNSAEYLFENKENIKAISQVEMPMNFLYRHSIELFLKSLIIIFHKRLKLPYGTEPYDSNSPKILTGGNWKDLYTCHWIDELYNYWLNELLLKNKAKLDELATNGDWQEYKEITDFFPFIAGYDRDSSFFRYPVTKNSSLDPKKFTMQRLDPEKLQKLFTDNPDNREKKKGARVFMLLKNDNDEIVDGFEKNTNILTDITHALKEVSHYFYCIHIMTRVTLCNGN
ncbi:hypothetical protein LJC62_01375 [Odoribacter sp. OttesenSCG-928-A06]|nr:hypothetical protein [Odoribacter sp. OttesenSCG-928-A06]